MGTPMGSAGLASSRMTPAPMGVRERAFDRERLQQTGTLRVHLKKGIGLKAADLNGKSDPYVKVICSRQEKKSKVIKFVIEHVL